MLTYSGKVRCGSGRARIEDQSLTYLSRLPTSVALWEPAGRAGLATAARMQSTYGITPDGQGGFYITGESAVGL